MDLRFNHHAKVQNTPLLKQAYLCPMHHEVACMMRCLELAELGAGNTAPNPMVGAVLVHEGRIIGEGFHAAYGGPHAEVNCIASVKEEDRPLISRATLFVSLEPCAHYGKTPPCTELIITHRIPEVVLAMQDPFSAVNGKGIAQLRHAGVKVTTGVAEEEARWLNRRFLSCHEKNRPYIILKWAQTANGRVAGNKGEPLAISNAYTNRLVHRWRSEESAILIGKNTAQSDNPQLTNRWWYGKSPIRIVLDNQLTLPPSLHLFQGDQLIICNQKKEGIEGNRRYVKYEPSSYDLTDCLKKLHELGIQSVLVEGGPTLHRSFLTQEVWDELRVITNTNLAINSAYHAPNIPVGIPHNTLTLGTDTIHWYYNTTCRGWNSQV